MLKKIAMTKNLKKLLFATRKLIDRPGGIEGLGLIWGLAGEGKSTSLAYVCNLTDALFLRADSCWTPSSMLAALSAELALPPTRSRALALRAISSKIGENRRPIFIDEADYLLRDPVMLDEIRDIYDLSGAPVILSGEQDLAIKIQANGRFARRVTEWIEFRGIDSDDCRVVSETVCGTPIAPDLLAFVHEAARGNVGRICTALSRIDAMGRAGGGSGGAAITLEEWGDRPLFYDQPQFGRRARRRP